MAIKNLYSNLPGHLVEFKDGGLQLTTSTTNSTSTKSVLLLGTAYDGPINEPVRIDQETVSLVFGDEVDKNGYANRATLTKYAKQAFKNGFDDVRCMRVTGSQAYTTLTGDQTTGYEAADGTFVSKQPAVVKGNDEFNFEVPYDAATTGIFPRGTSSTDTLNIISKSGKVENVGFGTNGAVINPYLGFTFPANRAKATDTIEIVYSPIVFGHYDGTAVTDIANADISTKAKSTKTVSLTEDPTTHDLSVVVAPEAGYSFWTDTAAHLSNTNLVDGSVNGLLSVSKTGAASPLTDGTDYSISFNTTTGEATVLITSAQATTLGITSTDTLDVEFILYKKGSQVTTNITANTMPNVFHVEPTVVTLDVDPATMRNFSITSVSSGNISLDVSDYTVNGKDITITDTDNLAVGASITVIYHYDKPIVSNIELKVKSQWGGSKYKDATVKVEKKNDSDGIEHTIVTFTRASASGGGSYSYSSEFYHTIDDLILAMNNDMNNTNMFEIEISRGDGSTSLDMLDPCDEKALDQGGDDGVNVTNNDMYKALSGDRYTASDVGTIVMVGNKAMQVTDEMVGYLKTQGAYQILENYNVDYIIPLGVYADSEQTVNPHSDFQRELALVCAVLTYRTKMTHGFIDVKPNSNTTLVGIDKYVTNLCANHPNVYYMQDEAGNDYIDSDGKKMDIGWYTSCVPGPEVIMRSDKLGQYYGSPAIAYAALNAVIDPDSAPTNKPLRNVEGIKFKFSNKQLDALTENRMVCFKLKNEGLRTGSSTPYVVDGVTSGNVGCDYTRLTTVKVLTDVVDQIREVADPFIGEKNTLAQRNALSALISKRLSNLVKQGEIQAYDFEVSASLQEQLLGEATIALTIVPAMELRKITTVVALRAAQ